MQLIYNNHRPSQTNNNTNCVFENVNKKPQECRTKTCLHTVNIVYPTIYKFSTIDVVCCSARTAYSIKPHFTVETN